MMWRDASLTLGPTGGDIAGTLAIEREGQAPLVLMVRGWRRTADTGLSTQVVRLQVAPLPDADPEVAALVGWASKLVMGG